MVSPGSAGSLSPGSVGLPDIRWRMVTLPGNDAWPQVLTGHTPPTPEWGDDDSIRVSEKRGAAASSCVESHVYCTGTFVRTCCMTRAADTWAQVSSARLGPRCAWKVARYRNSREAPGKRGTSVFLS